MSILKKGILAFLGLGAMAIIGAFLTNQGENDLNDSNLDEDDDETFGGVNLSEINENADMYNHGKCQKIGKNLLLFVRKSNRGHEWHRDEIEIDENGKLHNLGYHYPNQLKSPTDRFIEDLENHYDFEYEE